jgi:serine phosphatase RsbU (regulator of sigma subunit)
MSLRAKLIIAFLIISVVPLSAMTLVWHLSSVHTFERVAEREATETAADIGRRMEMVTANVGRRMDRLFDEAVDYQYRFTTGPKNTKSTKTPTPKVEEHVAPMLGDTAALLDRVEFHPTAGPDPNPHPDPNPDSDPGLNPNPDPNAKPDGRRHRGQFGRRGPPSGADAFRRGAPPPPRPPAPPRPPEPIVLDVHKIVEEASKAAKEGAAAAGRPDLSSMIDQALQRSLPAMEAGLAAVNNSVAREALAAATAQKPEMEVKGHRIEVPIKKDGRIVGKANAMLNLDRTVGSVLALARRDQGEIPFALDQQGRLYTPDTRGRSTLEALNVSATAKAAAEGSPRRLGDWLVVARKEPGGLVFGIARPIGAALREIRRMSIRNLSMGLLVIALACVGIVPISRRMTQHVASLSDGVSQLAGGDFKARVPVRSNDEFGKLAASFNKMAEDLERHQGLVVERERLRRELELSRLIQTEMLPRAPLRLGSAEIKGLSIPAREVGGDFFNYFPLPDGRLALLVGDVSGKGVSAALLMANVQATLRARLPLETDLARLADGLDRDVDENTPHSVFVTLFLGILDVERSVLRYVNAGHNPQFLLRSEGGLERLSSTGMPIALYAGQGYAESSVTIASGDLLFFYTDGLVETENDQGEMYGAERLEALLTLEHAQRIDMVLELVEGSIRSFRGAAEQFDDATMMALRIDA